MAALPLDPEPFPPKGSPGSLPHFPKRDATKNVQKNAPEQQTFTHIYAAHTLCYMFALSTSDM